MRTFLRLFIGLPGPVTRSSSTSLLVPCSLCQTQNAIKFFRHRASLFVPVGPCASMEASP